MSVLSSSGSFETSPRAAIASISSRFAANAGGTSVSGGAVIVMLGAAVATDSAAVGGVASGTAGAAVEAWVATSAAFAGVTGSGDGPRSANTKQTIAMAAPTTISSLFIIKPSNTQQGCNTC